MRMSWLRSRPIVCCWFDALQDRARSGGRRRAALRGGLRLLTNLPSLRREGKFTERLELKSRTKQNQNPRFPASKKNEGFVISLGPPSGAAFWFPGFSSFHCAVEPGTS